MSTLTIDIFELARSCQTLEGEVILEDLGPLRERDPQLTVSPIKFVATGLGSIRQYPAVSLSIEGEAQTSCATCNRLVSVPLAHELTFILTKSEAEADSIPLDEDEEDQDVIVGSTTLDVNAWVEEEVLLTLPMVARHDDCHYEPEPEEEAPKNNPFAGLADALKKHS